MAICLVVWGASVTAEVTVFAAASLKEPIDALASEHGDIVVSYGGSGTLARQVMQGAPADILILANVTWMEALERDGYVMPDRVVDLASNRLVLIGRSDMPDVSLTQTGIVTALDGGRIAIGLTQAVPAGIYAKAALEHLGLWSEFADDLAEFDNVRTALAQVIRGQAPLGIVYATDAQTSDAVRVVATFPAESHPPIRYVAARLSDDAGTAQFFDLFAGPEGRAQFAAFGFLPPVGTTQ